MFEELDFKKVVKVVEIFPEGKIVDVTDEYLVKKYPRSGYYTVSDYVISILFESYRGIELLWYEVPMLPVDIEPYKITDTAEIFSNSPLWTLTWKILWFKLKYGRETYYIGYKLSPCISSTILHWVSKTPVKVTKNPEEVKDESLPEGHVCVYCGTPLPDEPDDWEYGLGHDGESNVPVFICPKCGSKNYGFRLGEFVKDIYT